MGYVGDARKSRGFHLLPEIIRKLEINKNSLSYLIQFSKVSDDLIETKKELYNLSKNNKKIKILEKYML